MVVATAVLVREPVGVVVGDRAVERAVRDHGQQGRSRAARRLHRRDEAVAGDAARSLHHRRGGRGGRAAAGRGQPRPRPIARPRDHLVRNPRIDKVSFTGSTAAGSRIASVCGARMARCTLELGGKSAAIVLDDFPIEAAAKHPRPARSP